MVRKLLVGLLVVILLMACQLFDNIHIFAEEKPDVSIKESFNGNKETNNLKVKELDLGDIQKEMKIGETQLITPTCLPQNAIDPEFTFKSNNEKVATINGFGRITAHSVGSTVITVEVDGITESFTLMVKEKAQTSVKDIELGDYKEVMEVGKAQDITATVLPSSASDSTLEYISSDKEVASISSSGVLKALKKGETIITVKAGEVSKQFKFKVEAATTSIEINKTFLVLKTGDQFQLICKVLPPEANQMIKYKSTDESIASVDQSGFVTAVDSGETTVIVSNEYMNSAVNIIVNKDRAISDGNSVLPDKSSKVEDDYLLNLLNKSDMTTKLRINDISIVSKQILKHLYKLKHTLIIEGAKYNIILDGKNIVNYENEFLTKVLFKEVKSGIELIINDNKDLPGSISISFKGDEFLQKDHLYLFNNSKDKYELLNNSVKDGTMIIDVPGKYLLAKDKIDSLTVSIGLFVLAFIFLIVLTIAYTITKKRYWFW